MTIMRHDDGRRPLPLRSWHCCGACVRAVWAGGFSHECRCTRKTLPRPANLRVLLVEDSEIDAELLVRELQRFGYAPAWERVDTPEALQAALVRQPWDLVLADYAMPRFSGLDALELVKASGLELPFILVSGTIGEETAVAAMRAGAYDYLLKDRLTRLGAAVRRSLQEAEQRRARRQAEDRLRLLFHAVEQSPAVITITDAAGNIEYVNPRFTALTGYTLDMVLRAEFPDPQIRTHSARRIRPAVADDRGRRRMARRVCQPQAKRRVVLGIGGDLAGPRQRGADHALHQSRRGHHRTQAGGGIAAQAGIATPPGTKNGGPGRIGRRHRPRLQQLPGRRHHERPIGPLRQCRRRPEPPSTWTR